MITLDELEEKCREFEKIEGRASFYELALEIKEIYPLQASIIILATWNMGRFRFFASDSKNLVELKIALNSCKPLFNNLKDKDFRTINFDKIANEIKNIYSILSKVKGVEFTGASKIFHLFCPKLIVIWDSYIRDEYKKKKYEKKYNIRIEENTPEDFLNFQKLMQKIFGHIDWSDERKTLPKAIDEYNYVMFTLPRIKSHKIKFKK